VWFWCGLASAAASFFFALTHYSLRNFSRAGLEQSLRRRGRLKILGSLFRHHEDLIRTTCLLHTLGLVGLTLFSILAAIDQFGDGPLGILMGTAVAAVAGLVLGGALPMAWARYGADAILGVTLPFLNACRLALMPVARAMAPLDGLMRRLAGAPPGPRGLSPVEAEILSVVGEGERLGALDPTRHDMIERVLKFTRSSAGQIMTPRTDIVSIEASASLDDARRLVAARGFSRIPVTRGNIDTIVGILYAKDLLAGEAGEGPTKHVKDIGRPPVFVPETKRLDELLEEFRGDKVHMAVVLDEYGGTAGLVTIEDVVEEIVGEIIDEYEQAPPAPIRRLDARTYEIEARVHTRQLNSRLGLALPEHEDYETVGGFILSRLGSIPKTGESVTHEGVRLTVLEANDRRIKRVRIDLPVPAEAPPNP
jgi:CBS domain containing-hemolysin-like protein